MLKEKTIIVGICGGIAAYKVVEVVRRLRKLGASVHVIMTKNSMEFVTPLTFRTVSNNPVISEVFEEPNKWDIEHISLATKSDLMVIAPATGNMIGKVASGIADDILTTTIMAFKGPKIFVPAMNEDMYENPIVNENIKKLEKLGYIFLEPDEGLMACGTVGKGRLPEPVHIVESIESYFESEKNKIIKENKLKEDLKEVQILITAGPTREAIDPIRYMTNHSSGKMGYSIAKRAAIRGAKVKVVSGPVIAERCENVEFIDVVTAEEMYNEVMKHYKDSDVMIMVAAVADYRCKDVCANKIKKEDTEITLTLVKNPDIAKEVGNVKGNRILVGFCAETDHLIENANAKIKAKNMDMIVANDVTQEGAGFSVDTNIVKIIRKDGKCIDLPLQSKDCVADKILDEIKEMYSKF